MVFSDNPMSSPRPLPAFWRQLQKAFKRIPWFHYALAALFVLAGLWVLYQQDVDKTLTCTQQAGSGAQCRITIHSVFGTRTQNLDLQNSAQARVERRLYAGRGFAGANYHVTLVNLIGKKQALFVYPKNQKRQAEAQAAMLNQFLQTSQSQSLQLQQHHKQWVNGLVLIAIGIGYILALVTLCVLASRK